MKNIIVSNETLPSARQIKDLAQEFIRDLDASETTRVTYKKALTKFILWLDEDRPTRATIIEYKKYLLEEKAALTVSLYMAVVRQFFAYLENRRIYPNIAQGIKGLPKSDEPLTAWFTDIEARRIVDGIELNSVADYRDAAMITLMIHTGIRTIEAVRADIGDIGTEGGEKILRIWGKGRAGKDRKVVLVEEVLNSLMDYWQKRGSSKDDEPLFVSHSNRNQSRRLTTKSIRDIVSARFTNVGLKTPLTSAHSLRHTAAVLAIAGGANIVAVQEMLGHSNINTTRIYAKLLNRITDSAERKIQF
jgi:site-specific recombinase XerD